MTVLLDTPISTDRVQLHYAGADRREPFSSPQFIFGKMVASAAPVVREYHSDLYHDALSLEGFLAKESPFYFVVRKYGTHLLSHNGVNAHLQVTSSDCRVYRISLHVDDATGYWAADFDLMLDTIGEDN